MRRKQSVSSRGASLEGNFGAAAFHAFWRNAAIHTVMAGLVPAIHALLQSVSQIVPFAVDTIYEPHFPSAGSMFHRFFALNGKSDVIEWFKINEAREAVPLRESFE